MYRIPTFRRLHLGWGVLSSSLQQHLYELEAPIQHCQMECISSDLQ